MLTETDALYAAFAAPKPTQIDGCPCCIDSKNICVLLTKPLRALTSEDIGAYANSVFLTVGSDQDFRYFVPRILEVCASDPGFYPAAEIVLGKMRLANWVDWTGTQRAAIEAFVGVWFERMLGSIAHDEHDAFVADGVLCGIGRSGLKLQPFFDLLLSRPAALKAIFEQNSHDLYMSRRLRNPFWEDAPEAAQTVAAFLLSPEVELKMAEAE